MHIETLMQYFLWTEFICKCESLLTFYISIIEAIISIALKDLKSYIKNLRYTDWIAFILIVVRKTSLHTNVYISCFCSQKMYNVQINNISRTFLSLQLLFINYNVSSCNVVFPQMIVFHCKKEGVLSCFLNSTRLSFLFTQKIRKSKYNRILNMIRVKN